MKQQTEKWRQKFINKVQNKICSLDFLFLKKCFYFSLMATCFFFILTIGELFGKLLSSMIDLRNLVSVLLYASSLFCLSTSFKEYYVIFLRIVQF